MPPKFGCSLSRAHKNSIRKALDGRKKTEEHSVNIQAAKLAKHGVTIDEVTTARKDGLRWCTRHHCFLKAESFRSRFAGNCRECTPKVSFEYRHNLPYSWYTEKLAKQGGKCALCRKTPEELGLLHLELDHDHKCCNGENKRTCGKCARALLCAPCNKLLGYIENNFGLLDRIWKYISGDFTC